MDDNVFPCIRMCYYNWLNSYRYDDRKRAELHDDKFGDDRCTQPNLTDFSFLRLHRMGMYGIILH